MRERIWKWLLVIFDGIVMQPWRTTQAYPSNRWKKFIVELLTKAHILHSFRISDSNFISPRNHTPPTLSIQAQVAVAWVFALPVALTFLVCFLPPGSSAATTEVA
jgi:hypothetical protein